MPTATNACSPCSAALSCLAAHAHYTSAPSHVSCRPSRARALVWQPATQEQVYNVQQVVVQLTQNNCSNKHELRKVLQNYLGQDRIVEAHLLLSLLQQVVAC